MNRSWILGLALVAGNADLARADDAPDTTTTASNAARWPAYIGIGAAMLGVTAGTVAAFDASDQAERAHGLYRTDPRFMAARDAFERDRGVAIAAFSIATVGVAFATYWSVTQLPDTRLTASIGGGHAMLVFEHVR